MALLIGFPLLVLLALGHRAEATLPKVRNWMNTNSWVVSEIVIVFFLVLELKDALSNERQASLWEEAETEGDDAIKKLIDGALARSTVTAALIGANTRLAQVGEL